MNSFKLVGVIVMVLSLAFTHATLLVGVGSRRVDIRGEITKLHQASSEDQGRIIGTIFVEGDKKANENLDQANLIVTGDTRIFAQQGDRRRRARFEDLRVGDMVEAQFVEGPTIMIYPLQVEASEILVLDTGRH